MKHLLLIAALLFPTAAMAADKVSLESQVFVERTVTGADGKARVTREEPKLVTPGDKIVFVLTYKNVGDAAANSFVVTNPIPDSIEFVAAETADANVSVDGGKPSRRSRASRSRPPTAAFAPPPRPTSISFAGSSPSRSRSGRAASSVPRASYADLSSVPRHGAGGGDDGAAKRRKK